MARLKQGRRIATGGAKLRKAAAAKHAVKKQAVQLCMTITNGVFQHHRRRKQPNQVTSIGWLGFSAALEAGGSGGPWLLNDTIISGVTEACNNKKTTGLTKPGTLQVLVTANECAPPKGAKTGRKPAAQNCKLVRCMAKSHPQPATN